MHLPPSARRLEALAPLASTSLVLASVVLAPVVLAPADARAIQWETQADRLQNISATLVDGMPVPRPMKFNDVGVGMTGDVTFLPKLNPTVGAKNEKVPQAKFHLIPNAEVVGAMTLGKSFGIGLRAYGGFLPPMPKFLSGIDAKLMQHDYGAIGDASWLVSRGWIAFGQVGWHATGGVVKGKIASKEGSDTFDFKTRIIHMSAGGMHRKSRLYAAYLVGLKDTLSKLAIAEDDTSLELRDKLDDAQIPLLSQATVGWAPSFGANVALSFLYVPNRIYTTRLSLGYVHYFAEPATTASKDARASDLEADDDSGAAASKVPAKAPAKAPPKVPGRSPTGESAPESTEAETGNLPGGEPTPEGRPAATPAPVPGDGTTGKSPRTRARPRRAPAVPGAVAPSNAPVP
jgi:hypothetical protein